MFAPCRKNLGDDLIDLQASAIVSAATSPRQQFSAPEAQITPGLSRIVCQVKNPEQSRLHQTAAVHQVKNVIDAPPQIGRSSINLDQGNIHFKFGNPIPFSRGGAADVQAKA
jgi:hypothetical protein